MTNNMVYKLISFNTSNIDDFIKQLVDARAEIFRQGGQKSVKGAWVGFSEYGCEVSYERPMTSVEIKIREDANLKALESRRKHYEELKKEFEPE